MSTCESDSVHFLRRPHTGGKAHLTFIICLKGCNLQSQGCNNVFIMVSLPFFTWYRRTGRTLYKDKLIINIIEYI